MKSVVFAVLSFAATLAACDDDTRLFSESRVYHHELFATPQECEAAQQAGFINCAQTAAFCETGEAVVVVTDIINPARYRIDGDELRVSFPTVSEVSDPMLFRVSADEDTLYLKPSLQPWVRQQLIDPIDC